MQRISNAPVLFAQDLTYNEQTKTITEEASTLGIPPGRAPHGWLYPKSTHLGIYIKDNRNGKVTAWYPDSEDKRGDEIVGWRYRPSAESLKEDRSLYSWQLVIIND
jgi:hypothetical protein